MGKLKSSRLSLTFVLTDNKGSYPALTDNKKTFKSPECDEYIK